MSKEVEITEWFRGQERLEAASFPIGIGDDMAMVNLGAGRSVLVTTDMLLEGTHFRLEEASLEQVGYKAMAVNLSDCAAMSTMPFCAVCSVGMNRGMGPEGLRRLYTGIRRAADMFDCPLIGGDITSWDKGLSINITMLSRPIGTGPVRRSTARVGDAVCVTGRLGGSIRGRHLEFVPRVKEAIKLANAARLNAMMDLSDGLSTDLGHICRLSGVGAIVEAQAVPVSEAAKASDDPLMSALNDGEDFELLFTLGGGEYEELKKNWSDPLPITKVGEITEDKGVRIRLADGSVKRLEAKGYDHLG